MPRGKVGEPAGHVGEPAVPSGEPAAPTGEPTVPTGEPTVPMAEPAVQVGGPWCRLPGRGCSAEGERVPGLRIPPPGGVHRASGFQAPFRSSRRRVSTVSFVPSKRRSWSPPGLHAPPPNELPVCRGPGCRASEAARTVGTSGSFGGVASRCHQAFPSPPVSAPSILGSLVPGSLILGSLVLGSLILGSLVLGSLVLGSLVLGSFSVRSGGDKQHSKDSTHESLNWTDKRIRIPHRGDSVHAAVCRKTHRRKNRQQICNRETGSENEQKTGHGSSLFPSHLIGDNDAQNEG